MSDRNVTASADRLFAGGGETGAVLASIDWARTPLGPVETWPQALRTSLRICLTSRHDILLWWGPEFIIFYNDAYAPTLGIKHPWAAGKPGREVWPEVWDVVGPMLEGVLRTGQPTWSHDELLYLERNGYPEETYHTFSYSPIEDDNGNVGGVFTAVTETTPRVLAERRAVAARDVAAAVVDARTAEDVCARAARALAADPQDVPFALFYLLDHEHHRARLVTSTGLSVDSPLAPADVGLEETHGPPTAQRAAHAARHDADDSFTWPLGRVTRTGQHEIITELPNWIGETDALAAQILPPRAVALPVIEPGQGAPSAILVAGVNPHRTLDDEYERFYALLASHLAAALASAHAYEEERRRAEALAAIDRAKTAFFSNVSHEFRTPLTLLLGPLEDSLTDTEQPLAPRLRERLEVMERNGVRLLKLVNTLLDFTRIEAGRVQASYAPTDLSAYTAELASNFRSLIERAGMRLVVDCPPLDDAITAPVYVDREMWEKVVLNLLSNAFKFTLAGSITVATRAVDGGRSVELLVRDTGVGIPPEELPRLFERFHRVERVRARTHEGSGIGLALVQELVHLHGGTIRVESAEDVGTTFTARVPTGAGHLPPDRVLAMSSLATTAVGAAAFVGEAARWLPDGPDGSLWGQAPGQLVADGDAVVPPLAQGLSDSLVSLGLAASDETQRRARIVLADDNTDMREYLARLLAEHYTVEAVANGAQALAAIARQMPDLVLSDVMMPELDGFGLLRALRGDLATVSLPVILLSARAGEEATVEGLEAGADDYLVKPFSAREVLTRVAARLEIARTRAEAERRTREALDAVLELARELVGPEAQTGISGVAARLATLARHVLGSEMVSLAGIDAETGRFVPLATVGRTAEAEAAWYASIGTLRPEEYYSSEQLAHLRSGEAIVADMAAVWSQALPTYGTRATAIAPLVADGALIGVLSVAYTTGAHSYDAAQLALASGFARMAVLVLERERLLREREAAQLREEVLTEATRRMDEFLGIASHELRTPLTSITANVQLAERQLRALLQPDESPGRPGRTAHTEVKGGERGRLDRAHVLLERTGRQLLRMDRLVGDLLDASRMQSGKLDLRPEHCDLAAIVREAVQEQRAAWPDRAISLELPPRALVPLHADPDRIGQVVTNYLTNALKYSPDDQSVEVRVRIAGERARVEVRDFGPGLSSTQRVNLFERFYRVPGVEQQSGSGVGLGLGLYICRTIVERHAGAVGVESVLGKGSTFWFDVPLAVAMPRVQPDTAGTISETLEH